MNISSLFPEIEEISNIELRNKVIKSLDKAISLGGWSEEDLRMVPFTLLIPELVQGDNKPLISIIDHLRIRGDCRLILEDVNSGTSISSKTACHKAGCAE